MAARSRAKIIVLIKFVIALLATAITVRNALNDDNKKADGTGSDEVIQSQNEVGKHFPLILSLLYGPSSLCQCLTLYISYRKSVVSELIVPIEGFITLIAYIVIFEAGIFTDTDLVQVWISATLTVLVNMFMSFLFLTTTWHISFALRGSIYLATWVYSYVARIRQVSA